MSDRGNIVEGLYYLTCVIMMFPAWYFLSCNYHAFN